MISVKDEAVTLTATQLRRTEQEIRNVVDEYEKNRSSVNRRRRGTKPKTTPAKTTSSSKAKSKAPAKTTSSSKAKSKAPAKTTSSSKAKS